MIDRAYDLPVIRQAAVLGISRGSVSSAAAGVCGRPRYHAADRRVAYSVSVCRFAHVARPAGREGIKAGRLHVKTLMQKVGIEALYRRPRTSKPEPGHKVYPYLLRGRGDRAAGPGLGTDITYIPLRRGFVYLAAVMDWFSRYVLAWECRSRWRRQFLRRGAQGSPVQYGAPEIFNTDQGCQFTSEEFTARARQTTACDQHGRQGAWHGQHLRRAAVAHRQIRGGVSAGLRQRLRGSRFDRPLPRLLQRRRPHSSLDGTTPDHAYFSPPPLRIGS